MRLRYLVTLCCVAFSSHLFAFSCFLTFVKDTCWTNYNVNMLVLDATTGNELFSMTIPKGQTWVRQPFVCQPGQKLMYNATFTPVIWQGEEGRVYKTQHYWALPNAPKPKEKAWEIPVCFPKAFAEVPFPPQAVGNCQCSFKDVPLIPLQ